jgi:hypothetical protein
MFALLRATVANITTCVMHRRVAALLEISVAGSLVALRCRLIYLGQRLVTVRGCLVCVTKSLIPLRERIGSIWRFESAGCGPWPVRRVLVMIA